MNKLQRFITKCLISILIISWVIMSTCIDSSTPARQSESGAQFLFVQTAQSGTFDGNETLELKEVTPLVTMFSDRPNRLAYHLKIEDFVALWKDGESFNQDPPNASVSIATSSGLQETIRELLDAELHGEDVICRISVIDGTLPSRFNEVAVFVDDACPKDSQCPGPCGGCVICIPCNLSLDNETGDVPSPTVEPVYDNCDDYCVDKCSDSSGTSLDCYEACIEECTSK